MSNIKHQTLVKLSIREFCDSVLSGLGIFNNIAIFMAKKIR